jgi:hypothetical protein
MPSPSPRYSKNIIRHHRLGKLDREPAIAHAHERALARLKRDLARERDASKRQAAVAARMERV